MGWGGGGCSGIGGGAGLVAASLFITLSPSPTLFFIFLPPHADDSVRTPPPHSSPSTPSPLPHLHTQGQASCAARTNHPSVLPCVCARARAFAVTPLHAGSLQTHTTTITQKPRAPDERGRKELSAAAPLGTLTSPSPSPGRGPLSLPLLHLLRPFCFVFVFSLHFLSCSSKKSQSLDSSAVMSRDSEELPDVPLVLDLEPGSVSCVQRQFQCHKQSKYSPQIS